MVSGKFMADDEEIENDDEEVEGADSGGGLKKIIMIAVPVVLLVVGGAGAWFAGVFDSSDDVGMEGVQVEAKAPPKPAYFYDLPEMTVNLSSAGGRSQYLRLTVALELSEKDLADQIAPFMPRILNAFQVYLRELRTSDLDGSAGLYRLKRELLRRINEAVYPVRIDDVLFKEILIQ